MTQTLTVPLQPHPVRRAMSPPDRRAEILHQIALIRQQLDNVQQMCEKMHQTMDDIDHIFENLEQRIDSRVRRRRRKNTPFVEFCWLADFLERATTIPSPASKIVTAPAAASLLRNQTRFR